MKFSAKLYPHLTKDSWGRIKYNRGFNLEPEIEERVNYLFYKCVQSTSFVSRIYRDHSLDNLPKLIEYKNEVSGNLFSYIMDGIHVFGVVGKESILVINGYFSMYTHTSGMTLKPDGIGYRFEEIKCVKPKNTTVEFENEALNDDNAFICTYYISHSLSCELFKKYSLLKNKKLPAKGRIKEFNCRYKSELNLKIDLLTENWYTESCRNHPFTVRGHWRMQACGENRSERKLKWINTFMKKGYTKGTYKDK